MNFSQQHFFEDQPRHFGVVFFFYVSNGRKNAVCLAGKPDVRGFEGLAHAAYTFGSPIRMESLCVI